MAKASSPPPNVVHRRLNLRGLIILGVVAVLALVLFFPLMALSNRRARQNALEQVKASEAAGNIDLAVRHVDRYVATWPDDLEGLKLQARLLTISVNSADQLLRAIQANDKALRLEPNGPDTQEIRRRLIRLDITLSDRIRAELLASRSTGEQGKELRYRAAEVLARQLIEGGADDAESHRLLALALEGSALGGDNKALDQAVAEFGKVLALDPRDIKAAEHLAWLQQGRKKDAAAAQATMDALLKNLPESADVRMARFHFYERAEQPAKAQAELEAAAKLAPDDVIVRSTAAEVAIRRRAFDEARGHIDKIPATAANELRIRTLRGTLEATEQHPDEAIEEWRKGLVAAEGTDFNLTWRLAYALIQMNRLEEARPLVSQAQRLAGEGGEPMVRLLRALYDLRAQNFTSAAKELEKLATQANSQLISEVYLALGRAYEGLTDYSKALLAYRRLVAIRPTAVEARRAISRILALQNPGEALGEIERALAQSPDDPALLVEAGRLRFRQQLAVPADRRRWDGVDVLVDHALRLDPNNFEAQRLRADVLNESGRLPEALAILKRAIEGPGRTRVDVWLTYILALDRLGRFDEALKELDRASAPDMVGDRVGLRIARARVLVELNRAQAAREVLTQDRDKLPKDERPELAHALAELCRELGDRDAARAALVEWSKLAPESQAPGLNLISFAQSNDDDEAARLGLEALRSLPGGDNGPYGRAARALELLRIGQARANSPELTAATDPAEAKRLDEADRYVAQLVEEAPQLSIVPTLQGLILERRGKLADAIEAYRRGVKDAEITPSLPRIIELLSRQKQFDEIERLKAKYVAKANALGTPTLVRTFDQILAAVALKLGDDRQAERAVVDLVKAQPENLVLRLSLANVLVREGKVKEAEATLRQLAALRPAEAANWAALVRFRAEHPDLGDINQLIDEVRAGYKGPHPELLLARARWLAGDVPAATKLYDAAVAQRGDDLTTLREAVEFDEANGRAREAEARLRKALSLDPKATWASRTLALVLSARVDRPTWEEAWSLIKPGSPGAGDAPEDRLIRATVLARSPDEGQRDQAVPALQALARDLPASNPVAVEARVRLAQAFLLNNQPADAVGMIAPIADDADRPNPAALALAVEASARTGDAPTARRRLERLVALEPKSPRTAASRAWALFVSGQRDEAAAVVAAAYDEAEAGGGEALALAFQNLMAKLGSGEGTMRLAERIARKWPKDAYILAQRQLAAGKATEALKSCQLALEAGEVTEAIQVATRIAVERQADIATLQGVDELASAALAQAPKAPEVAVFVATLRHLQGRFEEEVGLYRLALENKPRRYLFLNNMAWTLAEGLQRYPEALERVDEAIRREGRDPQLLDTRGVILVRLGRPEDAVRDFEEAVKEDQLAARKPSATTYFHLARTYRQLNKAADYRRCRDMARKLNLDPATLDPTDKVDFASVMGG